MVIEGELREWMEQNGVDFFRCVNLWGLPLRRTRGYRNAILIGLLLSPQYIHRLRKSSTIDYSEFFEKEQRVDILAERLAAHLTRRGYLSYAQSERNLRKHKEFNEHEKRSLLPHKTIGVMAGIGWIGRDDLLVTREYGSAVCMCTVLTNAPILARNKPIMESRCGSCMRCKEVCPTDAIIGRRWSMRTDRDQLLRIDRCECCLKCLANCPWTLSYAREKIIRIPGRFR